jgi:hypothetical protein
LFTPIKNPFSSDSLDDEDPSYLLNTLYYTDAISDDEPSPYLEAMKRKKWLFEAYADYFQRKNPHCEQLTGPKSYLLKLIEFNRIALFEKAACTAGSPIREDWWLTSSDPMNDERDLIEIQICMTRLMRQKLLRDELRHQIEDYEFEGRL